MMKHDLNSIYHFAKSVEFGGFAQTERALGIPKSKLSRHLSLLEDSLGVKLIHRTSRQFVLTETGRRFYEHCHAMLIELESAEESIELMRKEPQGSIKMTCPVGLLKFHVGSILAEFMATYSKVELHLEATNRIVDVIAEGVDIALRVRPLPLEDCGLVARVLSHREQCLVASPRLVQENGLPKEPDELRQLPSLSRANQHEQHIWRLTNSSGKLKEITHSPRYTTTDMYALKEAAVRGVGVVQLPKLMLSQELKHGSLVRLLPQWHPQTEAIHLVFISRRGLLPSVRALIEFLAQKYSSFEES
ncbi:LysR family transcriptional regulator [Vibrio natriegens]|uniref:LysR substrate-binding domain-containing protein n=1 Tax=Vibrio natriegens TaxID=691 RepID=UPI0008041500|nr:LysR substrate-binding domain-containing protein [Vibrio natriegens]ANQ29354.1 LysR family transcriptional regulator [Vibrio natriegens]